MIDLKTSLPPHIPREKIAELEIIVGRIVETGLAEMIILFGSFVRGDFKLVQGQRSGQVSDFDLLIVTSDSTAETELNNKLRGKFNDIPTHVQAIVEVIDTVNRRLEMGNYFYADLKREGIVLFDSRKCKLSDAKILSPQERFEAAKNDFKRWSEESRANYQDATHNLEDLARAQENIFLRRAAFHLQQTAEMCYKTVLMVFTRYIPNEHYLFMLRLKATKLDRRIEIPFPMNNQQQAKLFAHLDNAYIGARYMSEEEYPVDKEQVDYWVVETRKLLEITEKICRGKIETLKNQTEEMN